MKENLLKIFNALFIVVFGYIIYQVIFNNTVNAWKWNPLIVCIGIVIYLILFICIYKLIKKQKKINTKIVVPIIFLIIIILQIILGNLYKVNPRWDVQDLFKIAMFHNYGRNADLSYLYQYSNNIGMEIIIIAIFKIATWIKIAPITLAIYINIIFIDIAILLMYLVLKKIYSKNLALTGLIWMALMTPVYLYVPIIYTDTFTMLFPVLIWYLYLVSQEQETRKKKYLMYVLFAIALVVGSFIKFTVCISAIAIIIIHILYKNFKSAIPLILSIVLVFTVGLGIKGVLIKAVFKNWDNEEFEQQRFPYTHWIMMGLHDEGAYNQSDARKMERIRGFDEKNEYALQNIKERLISNLQDGIGNFIRDKLVYTWGEGTYFAQTALKLAPINDGEHQEYVFEYGDKTDFYKYFSQSQHILMLILIMISGFAYQKENEEKQINYSNIGRIMIFGLFLFLLIWEVRSRYLLHYLPIMVITAMKGLETIDSKMDLEKTYLKDKISKKK